MDRLDTVLTLLQLHGPSAIAFTFLLWNSTKRERELNDRLTQLQAEVRDVLLPLVKDCTAHIAKNTTVMERVERHLP